ncbi:MAG: hypothetical protein Q8L37_03825 [Candidatus Gottesmanbacteria bacterium]|nr:hypothetical protein [Candidatus Gottesmanbacteria bacterium]
MNYLESELLGLFGNVIKEQHEQISPTEWQRISEDGRRMFWMTETDPDFTMAGLYTRFDDKKGPALFVLEHYRESLLLDSARRLLSFHGGPTTTVQTIIRFEALPRHTVPAVPGDLEYQIGEQVEYRSDGYLHITGWTGRPFEWSVDDSTDKFLYSHQDLQAQGIVNVDDLPKRIDFMRTMRQFQEQLMQGNFRNPQLFSSED